MPIAWITVAPLSEERLPPANRGRGYFAVPLPPSIVHMTTSVVWSFSILPIFLHHLLGAAEDLFHQLKKDRTGTVADG